MPLIMSSLKSSLESDWLSQEGGDNPDSAFNSGDAFAGAVANWFSNAQAAGLPCSTAMARRSQLAAQAASALQLQNAMAAGNALAVALGSYILGQSFGSGVALMPLAIGAAGPLIGGVFSDLESATSQRAQTIAGACTTVATSTIVVLPNPPWVGTVM